LQKESLNSDSQQCNIFSPQIIEHKKEQDILRCGGVKPVNGIPTLPLFYIDCSSSVTCKNFSRNLY